MPLPAIAGATTARHFVVDVVTLRENLHDGKAGRAAADKKERTSVFAPTGLVPDLIPDQPVTASHGFATECFSDDAPT
jgi:hypothetical protein